MNLTLNRKLHADLRTPAKIILCFLMLLNGCATPLAPIDPVSDTGTNRVAPNRLAAVTEPTFDANPISIPPAGSVGETSIVESGSEQSESRPESPQATEQPLLSPEAQKYVALCLLTGPLCAGFLLYAGTYAAGLATICTPVAAITTPMRSKGFKEEFSQCIRTMR